MSLKIVSQGLSSGLGFGRLVLDAERISQAPRRVAKRRLVRENLRMTDDP
jgi:hypothetical protein